MKFDVPSFSPKNQSSLEKFSENPLISKRVQLAEDVRVGRTERRSGIRRGR